MELNLTTERTELPGDVRSFLDEADRRIERFQIEHHVPAFVPSDFVLTYAVLRALAAANVGGGNLFCEWGSGFGVVTCLAAMLDFDACGIEIDGDLVDSAERLAADFDLPAQFVRGSFIPKGSDVRLEPGDGFSWLTTHGDEIQNEMELGPDDFNVIFAYPWPDEEQVIADLFERHGGAGAILVTYHSDGHMRFRRRPRHKKRLRT